MNILLKIFKIYIRYITIIISLNIVNFYKTSDFNICIKLALDFVHVMKEVLI